MRQPELLDLPFEMLVHIATFSSYSLKELRLTSSRVSQAATPPLFRSVTIVPHAASFANLLALSLCSLARHVHDIVFDVRLLSSTSDIKMAFEANEFSLVGTNINVSRRKVFALLDEYDKEAFRSLDMTELEITQLLQILPKLPNLEHITITSGNFLSLPRFYRKLKESLCITSDYYFEMSNHSGHHARSVLLCLGALDLRISKLSFVGIDWSEIVLFSELRSPASYLTMMQRVFRRLPREALPLPIFLFLYTSKHDDRGAAIEDLMPVCATVLDNVQHLALSLATARSERQLFMPTGPSSPLSSASRCASLQWVVECMQSVGQVGPQCLRSLTLSSLVLTGANVDFFLNGCQDTLTELTIADVRLYTANDNEYPHVGLVKESCWVSVLDEIPKRARHLNTVKLRGRLHNGGSQDWILTTRKATLRVDVERWLARKGGCPLDSERLASGLQGTHVGDASFNIIRSPPEGSADDELDWDEFHFLGP